MNRFVNSSPLMCTVCSSREIERLLKEHPNILSHWTKHSKKLNEIQTKALCCALKNKFQLIQGPPGQLFTIMLTLYSVYLVYLHCICSYCTEYIS